MDRLNNGDSGYSQIFGSTIWEHTLWPLSKVKYIHATQQGGTHLQASEWDDGSDERGRPGSDERWQ